MTGGFQSCAVLGASGYVGQHFVRLLAEHPSFRIERLGGGDRSTGKALAAVWQLPEPPPAWLADRAIETLTAAELDRVGVSVVFSALPSGQAGALEADCRRRGIAVFSNAADHRMDPGVPLLVPEVNRRHLAMHDRKGSVGLLATNPNCSATGLVLALRPVLALLRPRALVVGTYQALSGAGLPGIPSLAIADNVVPYIPEEEEKIARESARILGSQRGRTVRPLGVPILAQCARVGVRDGHLEAVTIEARGRPSREDLLAAWHSFDPLAREDLPTAPHPPLVVRTEDDRPQPFRDRWAGSPERARGMAVSIGRIRWTPPFLRFFLLTHNAVRGAAGGSVLNAEVALVDGHLDGGSRRGE